MAKYRGKKQEIKIVENIQVLDMGDEGKGVGKAEDLVFFIEKAVPGDVVDVQVFRKKKNFAEARIHQLRVPSPHRITPFCQHFGTCGGCKWQQMTYESQLHYKQTLVEQALVRIGKIDISGIEPILPAEKTRYYRNKLEFTFSNKRWLDSLDAETTPESMDALGFHVPRRFDKVLEIDHCHLQADPSNDIRNAVNEFAKSHHISFYDLRAHTGAMRNLIIRTSSTEDLMVIVIFAHAMEAEIEKVMSFVQKEFPQITSLMYVINQKKNDTIYDQDVLTYVGNDYILEEMEGLKFKIGPKTFYQTNSTQAYNLYCIAREFAGFKGDELVYDLYTGAGTIANFVAPHVRFVVGIEYVESAIEDAKNNSELNNIGNTRFFAGDMKDVLTPEFVLDNGKPDVIITDPPRAGMHPDIVQRLLEIASPKIVYVSCNAATQARDLEMLSQKYDVVRIKPVDMFPHTQHVENVVLLALKN